jgi:hypothetical protein
MGHLLRVILKNLVRTHWFYLWFYLLLPAFKKYLIDAKILWAGKEIDLIHFVRVVLPIKNNDAE